MGSRFYGWMRQQHRRKIMAILSFFMVQQAAAKSSKGANKIRKVY
jgi:hypothetical protein